MAEATKPSVSAQDQAKAREQKEQEAKERQAAAAPPAAPPPPPQNTLSASSVSLVPASNLGEIPEGTTRFEVMTDTWGVDPSFVRGDILTEDMDVPYDIEWAVKMGTLRPMTEPELVPMQSTTQPMNPDGSIDQEAQRSARGDAGQDADDPSKSAGAENPTQGTQAQGSGGTAPANSPTTQQRANS